MLHTFHQFCADRIIAVIALHGHQRICNRGGHNGVIRIFTLIDKQGEILTFITTVKLVRTTDNIA